MPGRLTQACLLCLALLCSRTMSEGNNVSSQTVGDGLPASGACEGDGEESWTHPELTFDVSILASLIHHLEWRNLVVIYDKETELLLDQLLKQPVFETCLLRLVTAEQAWTDNGLRSVVKLGPNGGHQHLNILLLCSTQRAANILKEATAFEREKGQQTAIRETSRWLLALRLSQVPDILQRLQSVTMNNVALVVYPPKGPNASVCVTELYRLEMTRQGRRFARVPDRDYGLQTPSQDALFPNVNFGLNGRKFVVTTIQSASFLVRSEDGELRGVGRLLLEGLAKFLNFTYELEEIADNEYGRQTESGEWIGMLGALHRKEADLALAELTPSSQRDHVADFSVPFSRDSYTFCYLAPPTDSSPALLFLKPFRSQVLLFLGLAALGTSLVIYLLCLVSPHSGQGQMRFTLMDTFFLVVQFLAANSGMPIPEASSARLVMSAWALMCLVMAATYTGNLVAFLAVSRGSVSIATLSQLVDQRQYTWGIPKDSYIANVLATSTLPIFQKIWAGIEDFSRSDPGVLASSIDSLMEKTARENFVAIDTETWLLEYAAILNMTLQCSEEAILPGFVSLALQNHSAYIDLVSKAILGVTESGVMEVWRRRWLKQYNRTLFAEPPTRAKPAGLVDTQMAFQGLVAGAVLATLALALETLVSRCRQIERPSKIDGPVCVSSL